MKKIHLIGIGGVGMAGLAVLLKARGHQVSGCDIASTPRTAWLEREGVKFLLGHNAHHLEGMDEIIATPAVHLPNEELSAASAAKEVRRRGEALADIVNAAPDSIVVCGSHGKTTTSTFIAKLLIALGESVEWCVGGETGEFPVAGNVIGKSEKSVLVVEGDESDGTLARYRAKTLVITNVEYDHPDHFPTPADYEECFNAARRQAAKVIEGCDSNENTAIEVALSRGHEMAAIREALPRITAELPDRRFQMIERGVIVDYAHHPTEIAYTLKRARRECRGKLRVLFQPHRYSRTKSLKADFAAALFAADEVVLCPTYGAFESPMEGGDVADLYLALRSLAQADEERSFRVLLSRSCEEAWTHAKRSSHSDDLTLVLGAGDIVYHLHELKEERIWIGAGSNTWKSDLDLPVEYVRTTGAANMPGATLKIPWMAGIPGTIGGWVKMNAGAFGHSIGELVDAVKVDGVWRSAADCGFAYRHSDLEGEIQDVKWRNESPIIEGTAEEYLARRRHFPAGTYGSFFKNPPSDYAGRLLESVGAKELKVGGAYVWQEHANVIVRGEGWTASDVLALARLMYNRVYFRLGVRLEPEVRGIRI